MADSAFLSDKELAFLRYLREEKVRYMIVGLSAAALQGAPVVTQDIDLWFEDLNDKGIRAALRRAGGVYIPPTGTHPPMISGKGLDLFDIVLRLDGLGSFEQEFKYMEEVGIEDSLIPVLDLERILKSKTAAGREKDKLSLKVLRDSLKARNRRRLGN